MAGDMSKTSWFAKRVEHWYEKDQMKRSERLGEAAAIIALLVGTLFFAYHQILKTGFFTLAFGPLEAVLFYALVPIGIAVSLVRGVTGHRNVARPLEIANALELMAAGFWFFLVFPFNFSHLADVLPRSLQFLLSWFPNWIGRDIALLTGLVNLANAFYIPALYISVRKEFTKRALSPR